MQTFKFYFDDGDGNGERYEVGIDGALVYLDDEPIASYKKDYKDANNPFFVVRLRYEKADLPEKCCSEFAICRAALTAYLLKNKLIEPIQQEDNKTNAYAVLIHWRDGSKSYLNEGDTLYTIYIDGKAVRLFRTREEAEFAGKVQKMRNPHQKVEAVDIDSITVLLNLK